MDDNDWDSQAAAANTSYRAGFDDALRLHAGVVAAVQGFLDTYEFGECKHDKVLTLESALNNLTTSLPWRNWIKHNM